MLCTVIKGPSYTTARNQISRALHFADIVELRLDEFSSLDINEIKKLRESFSIPMIFTLRPSYQGGGFAGSEPERLEHFYRIASLQPEYLDIESHTSIDFIEEINAKYPKIKKIISYHNFDETPQDLDSIYTEIQKIPGDFYKIAAMSHNCLDTMRLLLWAKNNISSKKLIAISMGNAGQFSRILSPFINNSITYASLDDVDNPLGQISAIKLIEKYQHKKVLPTTPLFGLIGDPVDLSVSDLYHNEQFISRGIHALYIKITVKPDELSRFLLLARRLPFQGLSVTMPLKELILPLIDWVDPVAHNIGAVNTLLFKEGKISGFNTDATGALDAIEKQISIKDKRVVIIGAGGAAKAIAHETHRRGGIITIVNRDEKKATSLACKYNGTGGGLSYMQKCVKDGYDVLINCTPGTMPISPHDILPNTLVMDIKTRPKDTDLILSAQEKGCRIVYGYEMFQEQAIKQYSIWNLIPVIAPTSY